MAAAGGDAGAQSNLATMYAIGQGVRQDFVKAHALFNIAVAQGFSARAKLSDMVAQISRADLSANETNGACILPSRPRPACRSNRPDTYQRRPVSRKFSLANSSRSIHSGQRQPCRWPCAAVCYRVESGHDLLKSGHSGNSRDSSGPAPHPPAMGGQMAMASPSSMGRVSRSAGVR
jgi:hypothetical protein